MNFRIVEIDKRGVGIDLLDSNSAPLTYRLSLDLYKFEEITLTREYFYFGYNDGENIDGFYFDNELPWSSGKQGISRATFLTRNFDQEYLKEKEKELIQKFYDKLIKSEINLKNELNNKIKTLNKEIQKYQNYQKNDIFIKFIRKNKLNMLQK